MSDKYNAGRELTKGIIRENPVFAMLLGMCPTLGVTSTAINGIGMGLATLAVLIGSNTVIALIKNLIPEKVRIPCFIVVIATFVTIIDLMMSAYLPELHEQLGLFIPLIVVNCIILGRAEAFASRNSLAPSIIDGFSMGFGFTFALALLGTVREILGAGTILGLSFLPEGTPTMLFFIMPPGAFIALGFLTPAVFAASDRLKAVISGAGKETAVQGAR